MSIAFFLLEKSYIDFIPLCNFTCRGQCIIMLLKPSPESIWQRISRQNGIGSIQPSPNFCETITMVMSHSSQSTGSLSRKWWSSRTVYSVHSYSNCPEFTAKQERVIKSLMQRGNVWSIPRFVSWVKSTSQEQTWENLKPKKGHGINNPFKMLHRILTASCSQSR